MDILKWFQKNWFYISLAFTLLSSLATGLWMFKGQIDDLKSKVTATDSWVSDHDDIQALHDKVLILSEDERLREAGLLK